MTGQTLPGGGAGPGDPHSVTAARESDAGGCSLPGVINETGREDDEAERKRQGREAERQRRRDSQEAEQRRRQEHDDAEKQRRLDHTEAERQRRETDSS